MAFRDMLSKIKAPVKKVAQAVGSSGLLGPVGQSAAVLSKAPDVYKAIKAPVGPVQGPQNRQAAPAPTDAQIEQARNQATSSPAQNTAMLNQGNLPDALQTVKDFQTKGISAPTTALATTKTPDQLAREQLANENYQFQPADVAKAKPANQVVTGAVPTPTPTITPPPVTTPPPTGAPSIQDQINAIQQAILQQMKPSEQEQATQQELDALIGGTNQNIAGLEGQGRGITLDIVRGQQGALARQAEAQAQTLEQRLATREATRRANLASATQQLGFLNQGAATQTAQQQAEQQQLQQLALAAAQGGATVDQIRGIMSAGSFGNAIGVASPFLRAKEDPMAALEMEKAQLENMKLQQDLSGVVSPMDALEYQIKALDLEKRQQEITGKATSTAREAETLNEINRLAQDILESPALRATTGPLGQYLPSFQTLTGGTFNLDTDIDRLKSLLTLGNLGLMSGVLSETDIKILSSAATSLDKGMTTSKFKQELQRIIDKTSGAGGGGDELDSLLNEIGFKKVGGDTNAASKVAEAIGQFESGGNYQARGPVVPSGQYKGEKAMGKYQIMPGNLPSWSKAALGRVVSEQEFMSNPQIQDAIAKHKMNEILQKYGTVEDVASVWFSGRPLAKAGNAKDVIGTTVPQYVKNVVANFNRLG